MYTLAWSKIVVSCCCICIVGWGRGFDIFVWITFLYNQSEVWCFGCQANRSGVSSWGDMKVVEVLREFLVTCMVSIINIKSDVKESTRMYQNCNSSQRLIFGGYLKVRKSLFTQVIIWVNIILDHIHPRTLLPMYEGSCTIYRPDWSSNNHTLLVQSMINSQYRYLNGIKNDDTNATLASRTTLSLYTIYGN